MRNDPSADFNEAFKAAFDSTVSSRIIETVPKVPDHEFSRRYRRKMRKLERRSLYAPAYGGGIRFDKVPFEKGSFKKVSLKRLITYALIAALLAAFTALSVGAARDLYKKFFMTSFDTHTVVKSADFENAPEIIEDVYVITKLPEGIKLVFENEISETTPEAVHFYQNDTYQFSFAQYVKCYHDINVNTENNPMSNIEINGYDGYIIDLGNDEYYISWDNGEYIFDISGNIGKNALIELAESVQKAEN